MKPKHITYVIPAAVADAICLAQTKGVAGSLLLNGSLVSAGGVARIPVPRHISIAAVADEHLVNFTIVGTDRYGTTILETVAGPTNGSSVSTTKNFKTITAITIDAALTGNITIGTANSLQTAWIPVPWKYPVDAGVSKSAGASMTHAIQTTMGDVFAIPEDLLPIDKAEGSPEGLKAATAVRLSITSHVSGDISFDIISRKT
jgi:hypothetical protein